MMDARGRADSSFIQRSSSDKLAFGIRPSSAARHRTSAASDHHSAAPSTAKKATLAAVMSSSPSFSLTSTPKGSAIGNFTGSSSARSKSSNRNSRPTSASSTYHAFINQKLSTSELTHRSIGAATVGSLSANRFFTVDSSPKKPTTDFRSAALTLEVELSEKLQSIENQFDDENGSRRAQTVEVFREMFDKVISRDVAFGSLLRRIKTAYETMNVTVSPSADQLDSSYEILLLEYSKIRAEHATMCRKLQEAQSEADGLAEENLTLKKRMSQREKEIALMSDRFQTSGDFYIKQKSLQQRISEVETQAEIAVSVMRTALPKGVRAETRSSEHFEGATEDAEDREQRMEVVVGDRIKRDITDVEQELGLLRIQEQELVDKHKKMRQRYKEISGVDLGNMNDMSMLEDTSHDSSDAALQQQDPRTFTPVPQSPTMQPQSGSSFRQHISLQQSDLQLSLPTKTVGEAALLEKKDSERVLSGNGDIQIASARTVLYSARSGSDTSESDDDSEGSYSADESQAPTPASAATQKLVIPSIRIPVVRQGSSPASPASRRSLTDSSRSARRR
eukprot:ANDGO_06810.mRNA.1 hypothetical protein